MKNFRRSLSTSLLSVLAMAGCLVPGYAFSLGGDINEQILTGPISKLKEYGMVFLGAATITVIIIFFFNVTKLGMAGDDMAERKRAIKSIAFSLLAVAILGGLTTVCAFLWGFLGNN